MIVLGAILLAGALAFVIAEAHLSTGGMIGTLGTGAAIAGVALLLAGAGAGPLASAVVAFSVGALCVLALLAVRRSVLIARRSRPRTGSEALVGHIGELRKLDGQRAEVFLEGALWRATPEHTLGEQALEPGDRVVVERVEGLTLRVRKAERWELVA